MKISANKYLREVVMLFLRIGATAFGGPAAYIAIMQQETVRKRGWINSQEFLDLLGVTNLIPGPNATEMALFLGLKRSGWLGYLASGILFIIPGVIATLVIAWAYVRYGALPQVGWILYGIKPVVIAIVIGALWDLGRKGVKDILTALVGLAGIALYFLGFNEIALLFAGAAVVLLVRFIIKSIQDSKQELSIVPLMPIGLAAQALGVTTIPFNQTTLFLSMLKIGSVIYGSGYVLYAFFNAEFVVRLGWLTHQELLDAIAVGQITPGPVASSATFVGYLVGGWESGLLATLAFFIPSFVLVAVVSRFVPLLRKKWWLSAFLDGVNVSALALMVGVSWELGRGALIDWFTIVLAIGATISVFRFKTNSAILIIGGAVLGVVYKLLVR
jgi:chromate transporter